MRKIIMALILGWLMIFVMHFDFLSAIENPLSDKLTMKSRAVDPKIKILAVDSESLEKYGQFPWSGDKMADLINKAASEATAVWIDALFTEPSDNPEQDEVLAQAVARNSNVYLPVRFDFQALQKPTRELEQEYLKMPIIDIPQERIGHINILPDKDNKVRRILLGVPNLDEEIIPIIGIRLANLVLPDDSKITWDNKYNWWRGIDEIGYDETLQAGFAYASSPAKSDIDAVSAWKVIEGEIDSAYFKDCLVLIGPYGADIQEQFNTPMPGNQMYEVELHANIIQALLDNELYSKTAKSEAIIIVVIIAVLAYALFELLKPKAGAVLLVFLLAAYTGGVYYIYHNQSQLLPYFYTLLALVLAYAAAVAGRHWYETNEKKKVNDTYNRYVSKEKLDEILAIRHKLRSKGFRKNVAVMFVNYKKAQYRELCLKAIINNGGVLDKYIGDGIMSIFGASGEQGDYLSRAIRAALEIRDNAQELDEELSFGIGVNSGEVMIAEFTSEGQTQYTVVGDTVDLAAGLEFYAEPEQILITRETYKLVEDLFECTELDPLRIRGKGKMVEIYEVDWELEDEEPENDE